MALPYQATATYTLSNVNPGERVQLQLGSVVNPNVAPSTRYGGETPILDGVVLDEAGVRDGQASGGVEVVSQSFRGGGSYAFDGTGIVTISPEDAPDFSVGFLVQAAVKPEVAGTEAVLIEKAGEYRLSLVPDGTDWKARFSMVTTTGTVEVISQATVTVGSWSVVGGRLENGWLQVAVGREVQSAPLTAARSTSSAEIRIGDGYVGTLDDVRFFDLAQSPLSRFPNGQQSLDLVADADGQVSTQVHSTGALPPPPHAPAPWRGNEPPADASREALGGHVADMDAILIDSAERSEGTVSYVSYGLLAYANQFVGGIWGAGDPESTAARAGDLVGSTVLGLITTPRDFINAGARAVQLQGDGWDALTLATGVAEAAMLVASKKARVIKRAGALLRLGRRGDAAGPFARRVVQEIAEHVDDLPEAGRLAGVAEVAAEGTPEAKQAVLSVVQGAGERPATLGRMDFVLEHSNDLDEAARALEGAQNVLGAKFHSLLGVIGTCAAQGASALDGGVRAAGSACRTFSEAAKNGIKKALVLAPLR